MPSLSLQADYVHSRGEDQLLFVDTNADLINNAIVRPDPRFAGTGTLQNLGWLRYNALQTELRFRAGTSHLGLAYTLAKTRSNYTAGIFGGGPTDNARINGEFDLSEDEGPDNSDRRHNMVLNGAHAFAVRCAACRDLDVPKCGTVQPVHARSARRRPVRGSARAPETPAAATASTAWTSA